MNQTEKSWGDNMYQLVIVDDEPWVLSGLEELIEWENFGFSITGKFTDPADALAQIRRIKPDVVITDIRMPGMSGIELIGALKEEKIDAQVVLISAYRDFEAAREGIRYGACQYILKPFDQDEVEETVRLISKKLQDRTNHVILDASKPESFLTPQAKNLFREASRFSQCCVLLSDRPCQKPIESGDMYTVPIQIVGAPTACLVSAKSRETILSLVDKIASSPSENVGLSRIYNNFKLFSEMLEEAGHSLNNGFIYTEHQPSAEIQLYISRFITSNLSLSNIAERFHLSAPYLCSMFRKNTGITVTGFIQNIKTFRAARMMLDSDLDINQIAADLGFTDYSYFGKLFRKRFGISPSSFRERYRL